MNINSNATSAIVHSLFRLVRDGSALPRQVLSGCCGSDWERRWFFMHFDRSRGALVCCVPIDRLIDLSTCRRCISNKYVVFGAGAVK